MAPPSMENLLWYLENSSQEPPEFQSDNEYYTEEHILDICHDLPWNRDTILCALSYTFSFISNLEHSDFFTHGITALEKIVECVRQRTTEWEEIVSEQRELSEMLVNSFFPEVVARFFIVPKLHQLPQSDKHLYPNEILAGFINFLLQVLFHESNISEGNEQRWTLLRKELSFLLALLGDIPFQCTHHDIVEQVNNLLEEFEMLANEAGSFVYDGVFPIHQMEANTFRGRTNCWLEKVEHLNAKIKEHCEKFSELPMSAISRCNVVDSFFIVHSLIEDIENLMNHRPNFNHGDAVMAAQMKTLHGQLTLSQSFIIVMQDNEEKEGLIQIRNLTYEAEYLINSLVVGNIHVWYLILRLPSIIHNIKLALIGLEQISETKDHDIIEEILKDQSDHMKIFEHNYIHLPCNLKPCFLYFAAFSGDFSHEKLTRMWITEGFIQRDENKNIEDTAEMYLLDLINRNLVMITKKASDGRIKKCKIQSDGLHEFCVRKAKEENFMIKVNKCGFSMYERCQRLCIPSTNSYVCWGPFGLHCRSFRDDRAGQSSYCFETMALLKAVEQAPQYDSEDHQAAAAAFAFPCQLRYLSVVGCHLSNKMVDNLVNLECIYVRGWGWSWSWKKVKIPAVVLRMVKLRHLVMEEEMGYEFEEDCCSSNMKEMTNLRTLSGVGIKDKKDSVDILRCFPHLHKLKCIIHGTEFPDLSFLAELESLKKLSLWGSKLPWEMMSIIGRLPNLHVLKLDDDAFWGRVWETRDGEFQKLKFLKIKKCSSLRLWMSCSEHFPVLECLVLIRCWSLVEIPSDFGNIPTLHRIQVTDCTREACFSALHIQIRKPLIQVDAKHHGVGTDELVQQYKHPTHNDLMILWRCMDEYFKVFKPVISVNHRTYFVVVSYALQFSDSENLTMMDLCCTAHSYNIRKEFLQGDPRHVGQITKSRSKFLDMLVNTLGPLVQRVFEFPKIQQLPHNDDKHLKKNEIIASFMDFLLLILFSDSAGAEQFSLLRKELSFLLAVLGDIPFQHGTHRELDEQLNNLLEEFEILANKIGGFLLSCVFPFQPMKVTRFRVETDALLEMATLLNVKIKEYCINFSELHESAIVRSSVVDSFFIVDSLVEDLQSIIMNGQPGSFTLDDPLKEQMKTLQDWLTRSRSFIQFLQDSEEREGLIQIRDLAYEAEYLINSLVAGNIHAWYLHLRLPSINQKVKHVCFALQQISETKDMKASYGKVSFPTAVNTATTDDNQFMDFNHDITKRILNDLTGKSNTSPQVIYIYGMPGMGKTTTANNLYNRCSSDFDRCAFCVVSQNYSVKNIMIEILMSVGSSEDKSDPSKMDVSKLGEEIHQTLFGRRYLIVLDDVWHFDVLDELQRYFPGYVKGCKVMITTRNKDVSLSGSTLYELPILSEDQCWHLLEKKVFPEDQCPSHLVSVGNRIAAKCSGVPLAVATIAGVLVNLEKEENEWRRVEQGLDSILLDKQSDYRKIMELSYEHLPHHMKPCFLYFARFSEDAEISTKELTRFWISQGFIQKDGKKSPEEIAEMYVSNLISRSLVMTASRRSIGGAKTCRVHDLLHGICIKKADEENFFNSATNLMITYNKNQHLFVPSSSNTNWRPFGHHCRSYRGNSKQAFNFRTMALLKSVDLLEGEAPRFVDLLEGEILSRFDIPFQLRYLGINSEKITKSMVGNLVNLEVLCVRGLRYRVVLLPAVILRMVKLRQLLVRYAAKFEEDCDDNNDILETTNLQTLKCIKIESKHDEEILRKSPDLQKLKCIIEGKTPQKIFPDLSSLAQLQSLGITYKEDFIGFTIPLQIIRFPDKMPLSKDSFPSSIKKLCLEESRLGWEQMSIIGELPNLEVLKLEENAFVGEEWETKDDQFKQLRVLKISSLDLKQWISESNHFPRLEQLVLYGCKNLEEIPSDLGYIQSLQRIQMSWGCSKGAYISAIGIEEEQRNKYSNQHLQVHIYGLTTKEELMREYTESTREEEEDTG